MEKTPIVASAPEGTFKLKEIKPTTALPGIERSESESHIEVNYQNRFSLYDAETKQSRPMVQEKTIRTDKRVPKLGVMLVGLGGNNGSTFVAGIIANKKGLTWAAKAGEQKANFYGSFTQSATTHVGFNFNEEDGTLTDVFKPVKELLPMVDPIDFDVCGWDISNLNLYEAAKRAHVLEPTLIEQLKVDLEQVQPMPAVLNPDFIAANQADRCDNVRVGTNEELIEGLR
jgi:myo-inositol-1-phosphate synthase